MLSRRIVRINLLPFIAHSPQFPFGFQLQIESLSFVRISTESAKSSVIQLQSLISKLIYSIAPRIPFTFHRAPLRNPAESMVRCRTAIAVNVLYRPFPIVIGRQLTLWDISGRQNAFLPTATFTCIPNRVHPSPVGACLSCLLKQTRQAADRQPLWLPWFIFRRAPCRWKAGRPQEAPLHGK